MWSEWQKLPSYNAEMRSWGELPNGLTGYEVRLPDGSVKAFSKRETYVQDTPTGPSLFITFDDLLQKGFGLTTITKNVPAVFELHKIDGNYEATGTVHFFCSIGCRRHFSLEGIQCDGLALGQSHVESQVVCETCCKPLE